MQQLCQQLPRRRKQQQQLHVSRERARSFAKSSQQHLHQQPPRRRQQQLQLLRQQPPRRRRRQQQLLHQQPPRHRQQPPRRQGAGSKVRGQQPPRRRQQPPMVQGSGSKVRCQCGSSAVLQRRSITSTWRRTPWTRAMFAKHTIICPSASGNHNVGSGCAGGATSNTSTPKGGRARPA